MESKSLEFKSLEIFLKLIFVDIGPAECLEGTDEEKYNFQDNLKFSRFYFRGGYLLKELVLDKIKTYKGKLNDSLSYEIFKVLVNDIYQNIKKRNKEINKTLDNYLLNEDFSLAANRLEEVLNRAQGKFRSILITNLIELKDLDSFTIGKVLIRKIDDKFIANFPEEIPGFGAYTILAGFPPAVKKQDFLEKNKENVALEITVDGYHFANEMSPVFDSALQEIKQTFAYLFLCDYFLKKVENPTPIEFKKIQGFTFYGSDALGLQEYYLQKAEDPIYFKKIDTSFSKINISHKIFVLSKDSIGQIEQRCCLKEFNAMKQKADTWEIKNKIVRSLDWFLKAVLEKEETDEVISLFISLESLLSTDPDYLTAHTDDMAENIAIMLAYDADKRYEYKCKFKKTIYPLRNKIMHHGESFSYGKDWDKL